MNKIKVTVSKPKSVVVNLKRLTPEDIANFNKVSEQRDASKIEKNTKEIDYVSSVVRQQLVKTTKAKRKRNDALHSYATRSKRQKFDDTTKKTDDGVISNDNPECQASFKETGTSNSKEDNKTTKSNDRTVAIPSFSVGDVVWCKIRGYKSHWPATIDGIEGKRFKVLWFNDYRHTFVFRGQIVDFYSNFSQFANNFNSVVGLETAAKEALIYLAAKKK